MDISELIHHIRCVAKAIDCNVREAERHIKRAHERREDSRMEADWYKDMAVKHLEFNNQGRQVYERMMGELAAHEHGAQFMPGIKAAYGAWLNDINSETAEVHAMIQMYK